MKKIITILLIIFSIIQNVTANNEPYGPITDFEKQVLTFGLENNKKCEKIKETDYPTIFIPGILASWYSSESYKGTKIKRWIPDPITHSYDTLFKTFYEKGYDIKDVFYTDEFNTYIAGNPKQSLYLFGYDWKKDNKITAKLLRDLILKIRLKYQEENNGCDIGKVNIVAHSMGGLVARAMLEDMCASDEDLKNYHKYLKRGQIKEIKSHNCYNWTKINKFITISTPHRGSPNSFALWTKGDLLYTNPFLDTGMLKGQMDVITAKDFYKKIHGYYDNMRNGIITIGQLLPDVKNYNNYNKSLLYLSKIDNNKQTKIINNHSYPVNEFLEELNKESNIEKMFSNISGKYTLYYSSLTGNKEYHEVFGIKNNIIGYQISDSYGKPVGSLGLDITEGYKGEGLYVHYSRDIKENVYNIGKKIINETGLGGDGTVPTKNLQLIPNDTGNIINNSKFDIQKIQCYKDEMYTDKDGINLSKYENKLTQKIGSETIMELCSHTKMPILTSIQVLENIIGEELLTEKDINKRITQHQQLLYKNIGYTNYVDNRLISLKSYSEKSNNHDVSYGKGSLSNYEYNYTNETYKQDGIKTNTKINKYFTDSYYIHSFNNKKAIDDFIENQDDKETEKIDLGFSGAFGMLDSMLRYEILSPINIIIEDEQGRKIGIDPDTGMIINEIPGAWTSGDTEGSNEPEFFLIPRTGTGEVIHKINTYGTGDGEYHIVMEEIKTSSHTPGHSLLSKLNSPGPSPLEEMELATLVIAGVAKKGEQEKYVVAVKEGKSGFVKIDKSNYKLFKLEELDRKYSEIFEKLKEILDNRYTKKKKNKLKLGLKKLRDSGFGKHKDNEKIVYLVGKILEYLE